MVMTRPARIPPPPHTSARPGAYQKFATTPPTSSSAAGTRESAAMGGWCVAQAAASAITSMRLTRLCCFMIILFPLRDELSGYRPVSGPHRLIQDAHQREPLRWRRWACTRAVSRCADSAKPIGVVRAAPDRDRAADDIAHHVVEVAVRGYEQGEALAATNDMERSHDAHRILVASRRGAERAEIVSAAKRRQRPPHRVHVELPGDVPCVAKEEWVRDRSGVDQIRVALTGRRAARVESRRCLADVEDADVAGEIGIESPANAEARHPGRGRQRRNLPDGMHASIGPTGPRDPGLGTEPTTRRLEQDSLHRPGPSLDLPAVIVGAVVGQHQTKRRATRRYRGGEWRRGPRAGTKVSHTMATRKTRTMSITTSHEPPGRTAGTTWRLSHSWRSKSFGS